MPTPAVTPSSYTSRLTRLGADAIISTPHSDPAHRDHPISSNLRAGESDEIMAASTGLAVQNVYFDITPLSLISMVITEEGDLGGDRLINRLGLVRTYPGLCGK